MRLMSKPSLRSQRSVARAYAKRDGDRGGVLRASPEPGSGGSRRRYSDRYVAGCRNPPLTCNERAGMEKWGRRAIAR
jgi:hypothetical protein